MELAIQKLFIVCFAVLGASHLLQPRAWGRFFVTLHAKGDAGNFFNALLTFAPGLIIVTFHNVWRGIPTVLTVVGWSYVLKATIYLLAPAVGLKSIGRVDPERANGFRVAGAAMLIVAALLAYHVWVVAPGADLA